METTAAGMSSAVESNLYRRLHAILRELETDTQAGSACNKGMLRWTLHKKVENSPSISISMLRVLVKELEKAERIDCKIRIIPLLHTLAYTVIQSAHVPDDLSERIYVCLNRLVTLPEPYCSIGLNYAKVLKMERNIPGALYQRRVIAEHSLKNEHYPLRERVFVFVDQAVFPQTLLDAVRADVKYGATEWDTLSHQRRVLLHTLQSGLGKQCHGRQLAEALEELCDVEKYFLDVVATVEERIEDGGSDRDQYSTRLQQLYHDILSSTGKNPSSPTSPVGSALPSPEISFHVWTKEDEIWNELVNFALMVSPAERSSTYLDEDEDTKRASVISTVSIDSGIEGDLPLNEFASMIVEPSGEQEVQEQQRSSQFFRRACVRWPKAGNRMTLMMEAIKESGMTAGGGSGGSLPKEEKNFTARLVVMGDDSTLGRLGKAYHNIRKREARHLFLTKRVNLEIYYIPVSNQPLSTSPAQENVPGLVDMLTLAASLGKVDPWYECNISSLGGMILKLAEMHSSVGGSSEQNTFLQDIISYYTRTAQQPIHIPIYSVKMSFPGLDPKTVEDVFLCQLDIDFPEFRPFRPTLKDTIKGSVRYKKHIQEEGGAVVSVIYRRASISNREVDRGMSLTTCGVSICHAPSCGNKNLDSLNVDFRDPNPARSCMSTLRVTRISIRTLEEKTFTVCLDKDSDRTFKNVQSIEVIPSTDPGFCLQKIKSRQTVEEDDSGLSRYLSKTFSLPINTFSGALL
ncbi:phosphoinositide 3-kinase regulatory subunit 6 isoform X1 [Colossoma macropomum]|uniref:phosphoinositide 3-kinase regulatory subunit 6 isoform X1 n=1 Tax=Colossoma macropomum TaxID=42526 RepID=UPI0018649E5F|nr:phosphoinositide 3-kinase regulatory subunit 6 isoform X1 [Colossoma macropomum]